MSKECFNSHILGIMEQYISCKVKSFQITILKSQSHLDYDVYFSHVMWCKTQKLRLQEMKYLRIVWLLAHSQGQIYRSLCQNTFHLKWMEVSTAREKKVGWIILIVGIEPRDADASILSIWAQTPPLPHREEYITVPGLTSFQILLTKSSNNLGSSLTQSHLITIAMVFFFKWPWVWCYMN